MNDVYEAILYDCYQRLVNLEGIHKNGKTKSSEDRSRVVYLHEIIPYYIHVLTEQYDELDDNRITGYLLSCKQLIILYARIIKRNSNLNSMKLKNHIERLIRLLCRIEAETIESLRSDNPIIGLIDLDELLSDPNTCASLAISLASSIIEESMLHNASEIVLIGTFYVTNSGKKFHKLDCPVCRNRTVRPLDLCKVINRKLQPCKCMSEFDYSDSYIVTAFIDESNTSVPWDINGNERNVSRYSYIICRGVLSYESQICEDNIMTKGVVILNNMLPLHQVSEEAISKVLITLAYDLDFHKSVVIYTDRTGIANSWMLNNKNRRLMTLFHNVDVRCIPREMNTKADKLLSSRMHLNIPMATYKKLKNSNQRIEKLEARVKELEDERAKITGFVDLSTTEYKS